MQNNADTRGKKQTRDFSVAGAFRRDRRIIRCIYGRRNETMMDQSVRGQFMLKALNRMKLMTRLEFCHQTQQPRCFLRLPGFIASLMAHVQFRGDRFSPVISHLLCHGLFFEIRCTRFASGSLGDWQVGLFVRFPRHYLWRNISQVCAGIISI